MTSGDLFQHYRHSSTRSPYSQIDNLSNDTKRRPGDFKNIFFKNLYHPYFLDFYSQGLHHHKQRFTTLPLQKSFLCLQFIVENNNASLLFVIIVSARGVGGVVAWHSLFFATLIDFSCIKYIYIYIGHNLRGKAFI